MGNKYIFMPKLQDNMSSAPLCAWLVEPGEVFHKGQGLFEIEIDKVVVEVEATHEGILLKQLVEEGNDVQAGAIVGEWSDKI